MQCNKKARNNSWLLVVGATGFEPAAFWSRTKRATKLRYAPRWSQCGDSDPRPAHYECAALPTELHWPVAHIVHQRFLIITDKSCSVTTFFKKNWASPKLSVGTRCCLCPAYLLLRSKALHFKLINTHMMIRLNINRAAIHRRQDGHLRHRVICNDLCDMRMNP